MCDCATCTYNKLVSSKLAELPEHQRAFFAELHENYGMAKADLNYAEAIIDGSWPSADECIAGAREERAKRMAEAALAKAGCAQVS